MYYNYFHVHGLICLQQDYLPVKDKYSKYLPHSSGRYQVKRFRKAQCPIVERLVNSMMMHGRNNGKKLLTVRIVKHAFEIINLLTGEVSEIVMLVIRFLTQNYYPCSLNMSVVVGSHFFSLYTSTS